MTALQEDKLNPARLCENIPKYPNIKIYSQKLFSILKTANQKNLFQKLELNRKMKILTCFCLDSQNFIVKASYIIVLFRTSSHFHSKV